MVRRETNRYQTWGERLCGFALLVLAAWLVASCVWGCSAMSPPIRQDARDVAGDVAGLKAEVTGLRAEVDSRVGTLEATIGDVTTRVGTLESSQKQTGFINFASTGGGIGGYLTTAFGIITWMFWRRLRYWKATTTKTIGAVEEHRDTVNVKTTIAKALANDTPFGRLVERHTRRTQNA